MPVTYYLQSCPTCGRRLQIRVEYMGRRVICYHCGAALLAQDPDLESEEPELADELLRAGMSSFSSRHLPRRELAFH
ncbi:MAG: hypothetical protein ACRC10_13135 [Thermoguttaceae bacterium]